MRELELCLRVSLISSRNDSALFVDGGLFLDPTVPNSFISSISISNSNASAELRASEMVSFRTQGVLVGEPIGKESESVSFLEKNGETKEDEVVVVMGGREEEKFLKKGKVVRVHGARASAMNTPKHLWAGAVAAMVSRSGNVQGFYCPYHL